MLVRRAGSSPREVTLEYVRVRRTARRRETTSSSQREDPEYDRIHSVQRAKDVGSLEEIIASRSIRPYLIELLDRALGREVKPVATTSSVAPTH